MPDATFGERLRAHRVAAGLTRAELAARAGVKRARVEYYESQHRGRPNLSQIRELVLALGVDLRVLDGRPPTKRRRA
jgi:transcriptional regulator with XRE-family HTH domain